MHSPNRNASDLMDTAMNRELQYNTVEMAVTVTLNVPLLTEEQRAICDQIMHAFSVVQEMDSFF